MTFNTKIGGLLLAFLVALMVLAGLAEGSFVHAQVINQPDSQCLQLQSNFGYGANDYSSGNAVAALQTFLVTQGYFNNAYLGTGHYGSITSRAVAQFQAAHGIPATGFVGPLTRAAITQITCGTSTVPPSTNAANLYYLNPTSGAVDTTVSVTGFGFTNSNTVLMDGSVAASNVPIASSIAIACTTNPACHGGINQTITFTIPSALSPNCPAGSMCPMYMRLVTPATYTITVQNSNGSSNTLYFTVTGGTSAQPLSVTGLDTPASLALGQVGTWTVHVNTSSLNQNLHYSVVWGDEATVYTNGIAASPVSTVQSSATFTHVYSRAGNYTPTFTVTDDSGSSVSASNTVVVTSLH
jgi:peptidoglycan hydrolase-like protein with peptidoglycan-binding domain